MKKTSLTGILMLVILGVVVAQPISSPKKNKYTFNDTPIELKDMFQIMEAHPEAVEKLKSARTQKVISYLTAVSGGWVLGRMLGKAISGNYTDVLIDEMAIGAGLIGVTFILDSGRKKEIRRAVDLYNAAIEPPSPGSDKTSLGLGTTRNGVGLLFSF